MEAAQPHARQVVSVHIGGWLHFETSSHTDHNSALSRARMKYLQTFISLNTREFYLHGYCSLDVCSGAEIYDGKCGFFVFAQVQE